MSKQKGRKRVWVRKRQERSKKIWRGKSTNLEEAAERSQARGAVG